jgi:hypothetical protein
VLQASSNHAFPPDMSCLPGWLQTAMHLHPPHGYKELVIMLIIITIIITRSSPKTRWSLWSTFKPCVPHPTSDRSACYALQDTNPGFICPTEGCTTRLFPTCEGNGGEQALWGSLGLQDTATLPGHWKRGKEGNRRRRSDFMQDEHCTLDRTGAP